MDIQKMRGLLDLGFVTPPYDGMQNYTRMRFLHNSIMKFAKRSTGVALEVGCFQGCSTVFLAKACLKKGIREIYSLDLFTGTATWHQNIDTYPVASDRMKRYGLDKSVNLIRAHSLQYPWTKKIDVFHLDADHDYEAVIADIEKYTPFLNEDGGIVVFDDYDVFHPGVKKAVNQLLLEHCEYEIVGVNYEGEEYGSICLRRWKLNAEAPEPARREFEAGRHATREHRRSEARRHFEQALQIHAYFPQALHELALLELEEQQPNRAILRLRRALEVDPAYGEGYVTHSRVLNLLGGHEEALLNARKAIELNPELWHGYYELGVAALCLGQELPLEEAQKQVEAALGPEAPESRFLRAGLWMVRLQFPRARTELSAFLDQAPNHTSAALARQKLQAIENKIA